MRLLRLAAVSVAIFGLAADAAAGQIRITEWMYNTAGDAPGEWVELTNVGDAPVSLNGYSYDDDSRTPGVFSLSGLGTLAPGESGVFTEVDPAAFRADWKLCAGTKVIGPYSNNLGRADEINVYDGAGQLADRLTYGDQTVGGPRTNGVSAWVPRAALGANDARQWVPSAVGDAEGSVAAASGSIGSPGRSTLGGFDPCTAPGGPTLTAEQPIVAGTVGDAANPQLTLTLSPAGDAPVTATSSNAAVLPAANIAISGTGAQRTVAFTPTGRGTSTVTFTAGGATATITYAASSPAPGSYYYGISDASSALDVGDGYLLLVNDETNTIFLHRADRSGYPVKTWTFTPQQLGTSGEIDFEGLARRGDLLVVTGSHGNNRSGAVRSERRTLISATITGSGASTELTFAGRYANLWTELRAWDAANGDALGFVAATAPGVLPNPPAGFNVEGLEFAPNGTALYLGFRAPTAGGRALIVPVLNADAVARGTGPAQFGAPIRLDLGGRSIRELRRNARNEYLIAAGPSPQNDTWALYTWDGDAAHAPLFNRELPADNGLTGGAWESIASVPDGFAGAVRLVTDSGDTNFYGTGATKDLAPGYQKSYTELVTLAAPPTETSATGTVAGTVPPQLALTLGGPAVFAPFVAGVSRTYTAQTTANVVSTAGDAALTVADASPNASGHLVNGTFALPQPLGGLGVVKTYAAPVANDLVPVTFTQTIGAGDALRTGAYAKSLTFTLSTTTP
ncbi:MAG TPA: DUF3616 domain-containing protein [Solirubrobacter sp.]|nr:DUF3616 domain-containing protein [Solirubrobacter sp.]